MKNLKKVLALVLAFACAFTMFAGAAFTDEADINADNRDAVELLTALNIISGYPDGSFDPEGTVDRAEMAKMIYTIRNGGNDDASAYEAVTTSFTDISGHWAEGYIKYLQNTGIVSGKSATIFDPDSPVTTGEAMKMALALAGYDEENAGLTGPSWLNNTVSQATTVGMTDDVNSAITAGCTRQDAAQILANTLVDVGAVRYSAIVEDFVPDSKQGLAYAGHWITVGEKWMDLAIATGYLTAGPSSKTNPKGITFVATDGYNVDGRTRFTFRDTKIDVSDLFGYEVKVVWDSEHQNDVDGVYGVYKTDDNSDTTAMWKDIKNETAGKVKLNDDTWTVDSDVLSGKQMQVYVNGSDTAWLNLSASSSGLQEQNIADIVTFIDKDADGRIETAYVKNQNVVKVTYVGNDVLNTSKLIGNLAPVSSTEFTDYVTNPDLDDVIVYDGIAKNDYAKVTYDYYNDKMTYEKIDEVEGTIEATRTNQGTKEIRIDGTWYKAVDGYTLPSLVSGDTIEYVAIDNLIYNAEKTDGTWGAKNLAIVYDTAKYGVGVDKNKLQIKLLTRDGDTKTVILDEYNNEDVVYAGTGSDFTFTKPDGTPETINAAAGSNALMGQLVTYRENGSEVSLMPVDMADLDNDRTNGFEFVQKAGYDDIYTTDGKAASYDEDKNTISATSKNEDGKAYTVNIASNAIVFVWDIDGDAKVMSGSELDKSGIGSGDEDAADVKGISNKVVGGEENGVNYVQACAIRVDDVDKAEGTGANYAYVLNASETIDGEDYRYFELWTEDGLLEAYEESSDWYEFEGGEIVTYDIVSTGDRTIIRNVEAVAKADTEVNYITSDGFYGSSNNKIAIQGGEYELASDCVVVNVNTDSKTGIEGDAKSAAREAMMDKDGDPIMNVVYVLDGENDEIVFLMIDGKNNEIKDASNLY